MSNMGRCRVLWDRSLDAHAEKTDHGLVRKYIRFRMKAHRKVSDAARTFNRAALKSDENRDLLNQAYMSARDEYDQLPPPLPPSNAPSILTAYLVPRKTHFWNIPASALGPRDIPHAPRTSTRTVSAVTPSARPHPISSQLFYAQRV